MSGLTRYEKETIILTNAADDFYVVYTFNSALKKKLAAYAKKYPDLCSLKEMTKEGSATYVVDRTVRLGSRRQENRQGPRGWAEEHRIKRKARLSSEDVFGHTYF